jgi:cell division protein FtsZ
MHTEREEKMDKPVMKVIGLGGGGSNAVNRMIELGIKEVEFVAANTDIQVLDTCLAPVKIQLGPKLTKGMGAGGNPQIGEAAAVESKREIASALEGADIIFLTAGMGGGTGTGSIPVAAKIAKEMGAITVAIVTTPFSFEMHRRRQNADWGLDKLYPHCDTVITVSNDKLLRAHSANLPMDIAFRLADDLLRQAIQGITELISHPGMINVSYMHILNQFRSGGGSVLAIGRARGENATLKAVQQALAHPLLDDILLQDASSVIANFSGSDSMTFFELAEALTFIHEQTPVETELIPGVRNDNSLGDTVEVILILTGVTGKDMVPHWIDELEQDIVPEKKNDPVIIEFTEQAMPQLSESQRIIRKSAEKKSIPLMDSKYTHPSTAEFDIPAFLRKRVTVDSDV